MHTHLLRGEASQFCHVNFENHGANLHPIFYLLSSLWQKDNHIGIPLHLRNYHLLQVDFFRAMHFFVAEIVTVHCGRIMQVAQISLCPIRNYLTGKDKSRRTSNDFDVAGITTC
mmetsp:Transcript_1424/g.2272  ORF Transcript_1424/g.2272 Transcript_1424/m.2272 type:complete len:114 (-) Transcript_1424:240-581(-)